MPLFPKSRKRPWVPEQKKQEGRKFITGFYHTTEWRKLRKLYITENPLCERCYLNNKVVPGKVVDHIIPINREDPYNTKFGVYGEPLDVNNLQTLCDHCHAVKSAKERWKK